MRFLVFIVFVCCASFLPDQNSGPWVIEKNSTMAIDGSSNVNKFTCEIVEYVKADTLRSTVDQATRKHVFKNSSLTVDVKSFDCHHKYITSDFRRMLKADHYPNLIIRFISLDEFLQKEKVNGLVEIELAGKKKRIEVVYKGTSTGPNKMRLQGEKMVKFSDFELKPPRKVAGLIKINEDIKVHFDLYFRKINT